MKKRHLLELLSLLVLLQGCAGYSAQENTLSDNSDTTVESMEDSESMIATLNGDENWYGYDVSVDGRDFIVSTENDEVILVQEIVYRSLNITPYTKGDLKDLAKINSGNYTYDEATGRYISKDPEYVTVTDSETIEKVVSALEKQQSLQLKVR